MPSSRRICRPPAWPGVGHPLTRPREVSHVPTAQRSAMPRSLTPPRSPRPRRERTLVVAFREEQPVVPRVINSRGCITSPGWVAAWSSRGLRFATVLADGPARLASPWAATPSAVGIAPSLFSQLHGTQGIHPGSGHGGVDQHRAARPDDGAGGGSALQARTHRPTVPPGAEHLSRGPLVLVAHGRRPPGGISAILAELARRPGLLDLDAGTVSGVTLGELIAGARVGDHDVIRRSRRHTVKPAAWPYSRATSPPGDRW